MKKPELKCLCIQYCLWFYLTILWCPFVSLCPRWLKKMSSSASLTASCWSSSVRTVLRCSVSLRCVALQYTFYQMCRVTDIKIWHLFSLILVFLLLSCVKIHAAHARNNSIPKWSTVSCALVSNGYCSQHVTTASAIWVWLKTFVVCHTSSLVPWCFLYTKCVCDCGSLDRNVIHEPMDWWFVSWFLLDICPWTRRWTLKPLN